MEYYKTGIWIDPIDEEFKNECGIYPCFFHQDKIKDCPYIQQGQFPLCSDSINEKRIFDTFMKLTNTVNKEP
jgi:hypothetical protein